jgi:nicotinate dehydrogenase subunit B
VNPDGLRNQIQGCVVQTLSRSPKEEVRFSQKEMLSLDWASCPILRFSELPSEMTISLVNRVDQPPLGAGEPTALTIIVALQKNMCFLAPPSPGAFFYILLPKIAINNE